MTPTNDGGPAFPQPCCDTGHAANSPYGIAGGGLSLRDYFAAAALQGMVASGDDSVCRSTTPEGIERERREYADGFAKASYRYADAMLAARVEANK